MASPRVALALGLLCLTACAERWPVANSDDGSLSAVSTSGDQDVCQAASASSANDALPAEVRKLVDRRQQCHHWAGEEPYDKGRAQQIDKAMTGLRCDSIEKEIRYMRAKYSANAAVQAALPETIE